MARRTRHATPSDVGDANIRRAAHPEKAPVCTDPSSRFLDGPVYPAGTDETAWARRCVMRRDDLTLDEAAELLAMLGLQETA